MNKYIKYIAPLVFLFSLILLLSVKSIPSGKLWKEYNVVYVPVASEDSIVKAAFDQCEIKDVVSLSGQFLPLSLNENSIEISMLRLNYNSQEYSYITRRNAFFYDKSKQYRLYYIPTEYKQKLSDAVSAIEARGIPCGTDTSASYPWLLPFVCLLLCGMLFIFVKNKIPFAVSSIIPLVFLYSNPFYPVALATCLVLLCLFFSANVWRRKDAISWLISRRFIPAMLAVSLICAFAGSILSGLLYFVAAAGTAGALISVMTAEDWWRNRKIFVPVYIRPARRVSIFAGKAFSSLSIVTGAAVLLLSLFFLTSSGSVSSKVSKLLLPAYSSSKAEELPQFEEYYKWVWNVETYPYQSLNSDSSVQDKIEFIEFVENPETGIIQTANKVMIYDDDFKLDVYEGIDRLSFNSVEKVMKSEGNNFTAGYSALSSSHLNLFGIIMCFICLFLLLFIYISIIIKKRY